MKKRLLIALLLSIGSASAETNPPAPEPPQAQNPPMVRNIGIAEQGDAIIVRQRKQEPVPAPTPAPTPK